MPKFIVDGLQDGIVTLAVPNSNYKNSFKLAGGSLPAAGGKVRGTIHAPAWKAEKVELGGNYVEPLFGRPRRMQGTILAVKSTTNELTVQVGYEVTVKLPAKYKAADFAVGERIGWDNIEIPTFEVEKAGA
jgi:hypothetical protein